MLLVEQKLRKVTEPMFEVVQNGFKKALILPQVTDKALSSTSTVHTACTDSEKVFYTVQQLKGIIGKR